MKFLKYLRLPNLGLMLLVFFGAQYGLLAYLGLESLLQLEDFLILCGAILCLASFGNLHNDYVYLEIDLINKPSKAIFYQDFGVRRMKQYYLFFGSLGVFLSFTLCFKLQLFWHTFLFTGIFVALWGYNKNLKLSFITGNALISLLVALVVLLPLFFIDVENSNFKVNLLAIPFTYFLGSFLFNFLQEIIKDIEDRKGDHAFGGNTMVLQLGRSRSAKLMFYLNFFCVLLVILSYHLYFPKLWSTLLGLVIILLPSIFIGIELQKKEEKINWSNISKLIKVTLLLGSVSLFGFYFS